MKSFLQIIFALLFFNVSIQAQTWTGSISNSWTNPLNWTPNVVPNNVSIVTLAPGFNSPQLQANTSIGGITGGSGVTLDFNGFSLTMTGAAGYNNITGTTMINSNPSTDIVLNLNLTNLGYDFKFNGNIINDNITINLTGSDTYYEGNSSANTFNGNLTYNINGTMNVQLGSAVGTQYNGNLNFNRNTAGSSNLFMGGSYVGGNFNFQNSVGGPSGFGNASNMTSIVGTCTINVSSPSINTFTLSHIKNGTTGGSVNVQNSQAFTVQYDSLKVSSFTIQGYQGAGYSTFYNNKIEGNVTIADNINNNLGFDTQCKNNEIIGNSVFTVNGSNHFYESNTAGTSSKYTGSTTYNLNGSGNLYLNQGASSTYNGNLIISRTSSGYTRAFNAGAIINGNFTYNNNSSGPSDFGSASNSTAISGTINMNVNLSTIAGFSMYRLVNQTTGGKINIKNTLGFDLRNDSLKVDSLNILYYRGNAYSHFYNNQLNGVLQLADSITYSNGYNTSVQNNTITGNTIFTIYGTNEFNESNSAFPNTFIGNVTYNCSGSGSLYTSRNSKSTITGNLIVNRTVAGYTRLFASGATISGNFSFTKNNPGASDIGVLSTKTSIGGTININVSQTTGDDFSMHRVQNLTNGGSISVQNTKAPNIQQDTLLTSTTSFLGFGGGAYAYFYNNKINGNFNIGTDPAYTGGYNTALRNNTITGNSVITNSCSNTLNEADVTSSENIFNGNVTYNLNGSGPLYVSHGDNSSYNGNLTINRTVAGYTKAFNAGATILGNFSYTKNAAGGSEFGNNANKTSIGGTVNMNVSQTTADNLEILRLVNATNGGSINIANTRAFTIQKDSLLLTSLNVSGYGGGSYAYFYDNQIIGNLNLTSDPSYGGGYATYIRDNTITGTTVFTNECTNTFYEADAGSSANTYNGNTTFNLNNSGSCYISHASKSIFNGNLNIVRTVGGLTKAFNAGANINGNLSYTKNVAGDSEFGNLSNKTAITGTINMNVTQTTGSNFELFWVVNGTAGGNITVQDTKMNIQKDTLKVTGLSINGYGGGTYNYLYNNFIDGNLTTSDNVGFGGGYTSNFRSNTITGNSTITINGTNIFNDGDAGNSGNTYLGDVTYNRNNGVMNIGTVDTNSYAGNLTFNNAVSLPINSELIKFIGNTNTYIDQLGTGSIDIQKLILNKTGAAKVTLNKRVNIPTSCSFVSGYLVSSTSNPMVFPDNVNHIGASDNSHVIGCVIKKGNDIFTFPLGNGIGYHPIAITAPASTADSFKACILLKHPSTDGYNVNSKDGSLLQIAPYHYWTLEQMNGSSSETVSLGWSVPCANTIITSLPGMAVARWNGSLWNNLGNGGTTGSTSLGTVSTSSTTSNYDVFALATTSASNSWQITSVTASNSTICAGTSTTLTGSGASTYNWQPGNLNGTSVNVSPLSTTTYTVTGTSATGCITTATKTIIVNPLLNVTTSATLTTLCSGSSTTITASNANTYTWMPGSLSGTSITVSPTSTTTYTVTGTTTATGCTKTATRTITVNALPNVGTTTTASTICNGNSTSITGTGASTYTWQPGSLSGTTINVSPTSSTTYTVTGTNSSTGCSKTATRAITVNALPNVGTTTTNSSICAGETTSITGTGANTYAWQPGSLSGTTINVSPIVTTTYTVTGTSTATGCTKTATRLISVTNCSNVLNVKLYLEGYYDGSSTMKPVLLNQGVGISASEVDTITVELRQSTPPYNLAASTQTILNTLGTAVCTFNPSVAIGNYYVVVKHRNSVETWSASPITINFTTATYDFANAITKAYGNNEKLMDPGVYALFSGDINQDATIDIFDFLVWNPNSQNFIGVITP